MFRETYEFPTSITLLLLKVLLHIKKERFNQTETLIQSKVPVQSYFRIEVYAEIKYYRLNKSPGVKRKV